MHTSRELAQANTVPRVKNYNLNTNSEQRMQMFQGQIESKSFPVKTTEIHKLHSTTTSTKVFLVNFRFILLVHIGLYSLSPKASTASQELTIKYTS